MSNDVTIFIPTYRRVFDQRTWASLSPKWRARTKLVTVPGETETLRAKGFPVLERPVSGISRTRQWILDQSRDDEVLVMMDDDLEFYRRRLDDPTKMRTVRDPSDFDNMMEEMLNLLTVSPLVGIANRSGANRDDSPVLRNRRMHDVLAIDMQVAREHDFRFDRVTFMEDFDFILQVLAAGHSTLMLNSYAKGDRGSNQPGGCSVYRDDLGQTAAAVDLCLLWPDFVKPRHVKTSGKNAMWSERLDVTVQWAKAAKAGAA